MAVAVIVATGCASAPAPPAAPAPATQNPSPMVESTRRHERVEERRHDGWRHELDAGLGAPVRLFLPDRDRAASRLTLLVHFMGPAWLAEDGVTQLAEPALLASIHFGRGGSAFERPLLQCGTFSRVLTEIERAAEAERGSDLELERVAVSAFSAGYGSVRAILRCAEDASRVNAVLLLDGLHTGYVPERTPLADGGVIDAAQMDPFVRYARRAVAGEARMVITHSEVFPGTFSSTTETADYLLRELGVPRRAVIGWGPVGMQQLSAAESGGLTVLGFAGNSAPDHMDHLHALRDFLPLLFSGVRGRAF